MTRDVIRISGHDYDRRSEVERELYSKLEDQSYFDTGFLSDAFLRAIHGPDKIVPDAVLQVNDTSSGAVTLTLSMDSLSVLEEKGLIAPEFMAAAKRAQATIEDCGSAVPLKKAYHYIRGFLDNSKPIAYGVAFLESKAGYVVALRYLD